MDRLPAPRSRSSRPPSPGNSRPTRQAVTKHLRILERAGIVRSMRTGRESLCAFAPAPLRKATEYLASVSGQWDQALARLKSFMED